MFLLRKHESLPCSFDNHKGKSRNPTSAKLGLVVSD